MGEWITTTEAAKRLGKSGRWLAKLCEQRRVEGARKIGNQWVIPVGAKVLPPTTIGRPLRTLEIPGSKHKPAPAQAGGAGRRAGKKAKR